MLWAKKIGDQFKWSLKNYGILLVLNGKIYFCHFWKPV